MSRRCCVCKTVKPLDAFHRNKNAHDGRCGRCKACEAKRKRKWTPADRAWELANREKRRVQDRARHQRSKAKRNAASRAYRDANLENARAYDRLRYERDKPKRLSVALAYVKQRRARVVGAHGSFSAQEWVQVVETFCGLCAYCLEPCDKPTQDHFTPLSRGGDHSAENIVPACERCNKRKHARLISSWVPLLLGSRSGSTDRSSQRTQRSSQATPSSSDSEEGSASPGY